MKKSKSNKHKLDKYIEVHKKHHEPIKISDARTMLGLESFNKNIDFMEWLHKTREEMEKEKSASGISNKEWSEKIVKNLKKKSIVVEKQKEVSKV